MNNNFDDYQPLDFNAIFDQEEASADEDKAPRTAIDKAPKWPAIKRTEFAKIEKAFKEGARDKNTVCAWVAYKLALSVCKGWPAGSFDELVTVGFEKALQSWPLYDPAKANTGIGAFLSSLVRPRMLNAARELFTPHGKRKHRKTDVLPKICIQDHTITERDENDTRRAVTNAAAQEGEPDGDADDDNQAPLGRDPGGPNDESVIAAANRAAFAKSWESCGLGVSRPVAGPPQDWRNGDEGDTNRFTPWTCITSAPSGATSTILNRAARNQQQIRIAEILEQLPKSDREVIESAWGLNGVREASLEELAEQQRCSVSTMRKRLNKLLEEIRQSHKTARKPGNWRNNTPGRCPKIVYWTVWYEYGIL